MKRRTFIKRLLTSLCAVPLMLFCRLRFISFSQLATAGDFPVKLRLHGVPADGDVDVSCVFDEDMNLEDCIKEVIDREGWNVGASRTFHFIV